MIHQPIPTNRPAVDRLTGLIETEETIVVLPEEFDSAILGIARQFTNPPIVVYDKSAVLRILTAQGLTPEDAEEHFTYNMIGGYVGQSTPAYLESGYPEFPDHDAVE